MNEDEKKAAIDILAAHIQETCPYLFQLSARHDEELELIAALATETGIRGNAGNQHFPGTSRKWFIFFQLPAFGRASSEL